MHKKVIIIGAGGHAKVIADIIEKSGDEVVGFLDDNKENGATVIKNYKVIGGSNNRFAMAITKENVEFVIAIGDNQKRKEISNSPNLKFYTAIHPSAQIGLDVRIEEGTVIMANSCINSSAIIEHDNIIEDYVHISPNATLGGTVKIGESTHVGIGSIVKNNITICKNCTIGAGAVVVKNILEEGTYVGVPARERKN